MATRQESDSTTGIARPEEAAAADTTNESTPTPGNWGTVKHQQELDDKGSTAT